MPNFKTRIMNTFQLKQELIHKISSIEDIEFLNAIKTILDYKTKDSFIELTSDLEEELLHASKEGQQGNVISQSELDKKVEQWLNDR